MIVINQYKDNVFTYNSNTGELLRWLDGKWQKPTIGVSNGYPYVCIFGAREIRIHRLVWWLVYGRMPKLVDHVNQDKADNRLRNLREVSRQLNMFNSKLSSRNSTGVKGLYYNKKTSYYEAWYNSKYHGRSKDKQVVIAILNQLTVKE